MISAIQHFLYRDGYGSYVLSAYGLVGVLLAVQWFLPWRRLRKLRQQKIAHE